MYDPDGPTFRITTDHDEPLGDVVLVKIYGQVLREYRLHPEQNSTDRTGSSAASSPWACCSGGPCT